MYWKERFSRPCTPLSNFLYIFDLCGDMCCSQYWHLIFYLARALADYPAEHSISIMILLEARGPVHQD